MTLRTNDLKLPSISIRLSNAERLIDEMERKFLSDEPNLSPKTKKLEELSKTMTEKDHFLKKFSQKIGATIGEAFTKG